jgi:hypothetical protein
MYLWSPITSPVIVSWQDSLAHARYAEARGLNMSSAGALVRAPEAISVGSPVYMESRQMRLMANAVVRHCTERKSKFFIGLEFRGPLVRSIWNHGHVISVRSIGARIHRKPDPG